MGRIITAKTPEELEKLLVGKTLISRDSLTMATVEGTWDMHTGAWSD